MTERASYRRLMYCSHESLPMTQENVEQLVKEAREFNTKKGITGMLLYSRGIFAQIIEGPSDEINDLYQRIVKDPRHNHIALLFVKMEEEKLFADWAMAFVELHESTSVEIPQNISMAFTKDHEVMQHLISLLPKAVALLMRKAYN